MALASFSEVTGWALALVALGERGGCEGFQGDGRHGFLWLGYTETCQAHVLCSPASSHHQTGGL